MHVVDDGGTEEDAHRALRTGQQVQFLAFGHGCAAFSACQDDGLCAFGNGELRTQFGSGGEERRYAGGDVVGHAVGIEEGHLFLYGTEDAGVARMQSHDELALVVELLHQLALFFQSHVGAACGSR